MIELTWDDFDRDVRLLAGVIGNRQRKYRGVCGIPRGGLPLAVALSHHLGIPFLDKPRVGSLVVDDIFETGKTLNAIITCDVDYVVWISKRPVSWVTAARVIESEEWVLFPWECKAGATIDEAKYRASR